MLAIALCGALSFCLLPVALLLQIDFQAIVVSASLSEASLETMVIPLSLCRWNVLLGARWGDGNDVN
ncbi:MAG: hypothetical protein ACSLEM_02840 [Candidatus Malihini olakiniferum]